MTSGPQSSTVRVRCAFRMDFMCNVLVTALSCEVVTAAALPVRGGTFMPFLGRVALMGLLLPSSCSTSEDRADLRRALLHRTVVRVSLRSPGSSRRAIWLLSAHRSLLWREKPSADQIHRAVHVD